MSENLEKIIFGLVDRDVVFKPYDDEPKIITRLLSMDNVAAFWPHLPAVKRDGIKTTIRGAGTGSCKEDCITPAFAELLERYSASIFSREQIVLASGFELGNGAIDLNQIPACSKAELSHPNCYLIRPRKDEPIRWVRALSLSDKRIMYVPVVMTYLYAGYASEAERIALPITTGCAAHISYARALISAILEVIERDALSLVWLLRLRIPRVAVDNVSPQWESAWSSYSVSSKSLSYLFYDATSDLGIPTIYGLRISPNSIRARTLVACASSFDPEDAVNKVLRDFSSTSIGYRNNRPIPDSWDDFSALHHGATYMAHASREQAFSFLTEQTETRAISELHSTIAIDSDPMTTLRGLVKHLTKKGLDLYAIDLTTDEASRAGLKVVRVIIPQLQPLPYRYRSRYLGNPRLYTLPTSLGFPSQTEQDFNRWPNPFA